MEAYRWASVPSGFPVRICLLVPPPSSPNASFTMMLVYCLCLSNVLSNPSPAPISSQLCVVWLHRPQPLFLFLFFLSTVTLFRWELRLYWTDIGFCQHFYLKCEVLSSPSIDGSPANQVCGRSVHRFPSLSEHCWDVFMK